MRIIWEAGIQPPDIKRLGKAERDLFLSLAGPDPGAREVRDAQFWDFTLSRKDGFVLDSPALPQIAVEKVAGSMNVLLGPPTPPDTLPLVPARPAWPGTIRVRIIWDAGIPPDIRRLGKDERDLFSYMGYNPVDADEVQRGVQHSRVWNVQCRAFTLSAEDGFVLDSPALPLIAVGNFAGAINVLLRRARRPDPPPPDRSPPDPFSLGKLRPHADPIFKPWD
jgi:hypothetical protein